jgi:cyclophilin family peptidyl-prolyl cis-trans isomerase/HEAT repeat protein
MRAAALASQAVAVWALAQRALTVPRAVAVAARRASATVRPLAAAALTLAVASACVPDRGRAERTTAEYLRVLAAEDARPSGGPERALLVAATEHEEPLLRRTAVRALGRLEDPSLQEAIVRRLDDPAASVRVAAALALAQSAHGAPGRSALAPLLDRVPLEDDPAARGALARALGRLDLTAANRESALEAVLVLGRSLGASPDGVAPPETLVDVALGLEALVGRAEGEGVSLEVATRLEELLAYRRDAERDAQAGRVRSLALSALGAARRLSLELVLLAMDDPDAEVRRIAVRHLDVVVPSQRPALVRRALEDRSDPVAIEAVRFLAARARTEESCTLLLAAAREPTPTPVRIEALAALASPCPGAEQGALLRETAAALDVEAAAAVDASTSDAAPPSWHAPVQALRSLARVDPTTAARLLTRYVEHPDAFVRAHAAGVAATLRERQALGTLSVDASPNVRTAAVEGLFTLEGHAIDPLLRAHLGSDDPWLLLSVAGLLAGSPQAGETAAAALAAFERISEARRETWRDPRRALLALVAELGDSSMRVATGGRTVGSPPAGGPTAAPAPADATLADRLRPYLADYDPLVAADVAEILETWTGAPHGAAPRPLARAPLPTVEELDALERTTVTLHMRGLGPIVIQPLPHAALTNATRFVRLAEQGYYDGLTFHRRVSNFVIQGGSPGANEYAGDGPYTRDEIELSHWRGTVGLSTRGRDTGDGQIFVNLVHNTRLDPDYTVFGVVTEGMDVVDRVLEGAVIERAEVRVGG